MRVKLATDGSFILYREIKAPEGYSFSKSRQEDVLTLSTSEMARVLTDLDALHDGDNLRDLERQMEMLRPARKSALEPPPPSPTVAPPVTATTDTETGSSGEIATSQPATPISGIADADNAHTAADPVSSEPQS